MAEKSQILHFHGKWRSMALILKGYHSSMALWQSVQTPWSVFTLPGLLSLFLEVTT